MKRLAAVLVLLAVLISVMVISAHPVEAIGENAL